MSIPIRGLGSNGTKNNAKLITLTLYSFQTQVKDFAFISVWGEMPTESDLSAIAVKPMVN
jgi:hypothetical protein